MPVESQLQYYSEKWINQPPVDLKQYQLVPRDIRWSSITICGIDGILWTSYPTKQVENIAGRFLYDGREYNWIVPGHSLAQNDRETMPAHERAPGGVKIPGGVQEYDGLSSALTEIHQEDLKRMGFEIQRPIPRPSVAVTVQQIATCILHGQVIVYNK